ncbi:Hint domain-containing protein [Loktanella salsilacus]|uniref:Hint domain-containing protein n=1 Tax=Loktanella salsilacus TaxID=195913 RepID=A0A1I4EAD6_9RHOB|nr:Hint domain-containing protein [Loktanella salsilacus]SFL02149.1 Hint domain-containing protein [Loktanella salsilacus]
MQTGTMTRDTVAKAAVTLTSGICAETTILTLNGEMCVEDLTSGTRIITRDSGMAVLRSITSETLRVAPIRIKAGSLGHTRPDRDMLVAPGTQIHIRDWRAEALFGSPAAMVEAQRLVDGEFLAVQDACEMTVYTLTFDRQHIVYADGIEMASAAV